MKHNDDTEEYLSQYAAILQKQGYSPKVVFQNLLAEFNGTPYVWGGSSLKGSDCSGSVCACLNGLFKKKIRVNADSLFKEFFIHKADGKDGIEAAFFIDENGKALHVAGSLGSGCYMNESRLEKNGATSRSLKELALMYPAFSIVRRKLEEDRWA